MGRALAATSALVILIVLAPMAEAARVKVNAAINAVAWDAEDVDTDEAFALFDVFVLDFGDDPYVGLTCFGDEGYGRAWVRVKVPGVRGSGVELTSLES